MKKSLTVVAHKQITLPKNPVILGKQQPQKSVKKEKVKD
jgi:hypothetical protein